MNLTSINTYTLAPNQFIESNGRRLAYRSVGEGKPLVLCVRFRGTMDSWDPAFIDSLALQGFRVITFDYSGLGLSTGTPNYSPLALAEDARDLIEGLALRDAAIGGWSLGAMAAATRDSTEILVDGVVPLRDSPGSGEHELITQFNQSIVDNPIPVA